MLQLELSAMLPCFEQREQIHRELVPELMHLVLLKLVLALQQDQPVSLESLSRCEQLVVQRVRQLLELLELVVPAQQVLALQPQGRPELQQVQVHLVA
jgi:hypothetical protein